MILGLFWGYVRVILGVILGLYWAILGYIGVILGYSIGGTCLLNTRLAIILFQQGFGTRLHGVMG